jgi:hypothetical protein
MTDLKEFLSSLKMEPIRSRLNNTDIVDIVSLKLTNSGQASSFPMETHNPHPGVHLPAAMTTRRFSLFLF